MRYSPRLLNYFYNAHHGGELDPEVGTIYQAELHSENNDYFLRLYLHCNNQKIICAKFQAHGSVAVIAACEYVCCWLEGKTRVEAQQLNVQQIIERLEMSTLQNHVAALIKRLVSLALQQIPH